MALSCLHWRGCNGRRGTQPTAGVGALGTLRSLPTQPFPGSLGPKRAVWGRRAPAVRTQPMGMGPGAVCVNPLGSTRHFPRVSGDAVGQEGAVGWWVQGRASSWGSYKVSKVLLMV